MKKECRLDFGSFILEAELFYTKIAAEIHREMPYAVALYSYGQEYYGEIPVEIPDENPQDEIPPGGLAYTSRGNFFCIFYGGTPAWPVDYIGRIKGDGWKKLQESPILRNVIISAV